MSDNKQTKSSSDDGERNARSDGSGRVMHRRRWFEATVIVSFWAVVALLDIAQNTFDPHRQ
ncbi:MAG: hypothetical protein WD423_10460 [Rhodothermales bacterium]